MFLICKAQSLFNRFSNHLWQHDAPVSYIFAYVLMPMLDVSAKHSSSGQSMHVALYQSVHSDTVQTQTPQTALLSLHHQHNGIGLPHKECQCIAWRLSCMLAVCAVAPHHRQEECNTDSNPYEAEALKSPVV